jgi:hypothetical protein
MAVPNREQVNAEQIACLLHIANAMQAYLLAPHRELDPLDKRPDLDGGALASATVTFGNVCKRLDEVLNDTDRWSMAPSQGLYKSILSLHDSQRKYLEAQQRTAEISAAPSSRLHPTLLEHEGVFLAIHGDVKTPGAHIVGRGLTPESALADFDQAFKRTAFEQYVVEVEDQTPNKKKTK